MGGGTNDTALELGGALGLAVLGSVLAATYKATLGTALAYAHLTAAALHTVKDSIGGALAVAQQVAHDPADGPVPAQALAAAADHAFAHAVAHTSLIGGTILAVGTVLVALILPGWRPAPPSRRRSPWLPHSTLRRSASTPSTQRMRYGRTGPGGRPGTPVPRRGLRLDRASGNNRQQVVRAGSGSARTSSASWT